MATLGNEAYEVIAKTFLSAKPGIAWPSALEGWRHTLNHMCVSLERYDDFDEDAFRTLCGYYKEGNKDACAVSTRLD